MLSLSHITPSAHGADLELPSAEPRENLFSSGSFKGSFSGKGTESSGKYDRHTTTVSQREILKAVHKSPHVPYT